jgi:hypothetical protein
LKRLLTVTAGACVLGAAALAGPAAAQDFVYAPKDCTTPAIEPKSILLACADAGISLKSMGWDDWNASKVKGQGKILIADCDPDCASGGTDKYKAKVTLLNIKPTVCGGRTVMMYNRAHVRYPGKKPPNKGNLRSFKLACNS